jgi:hypothetical protein
MMIGLCQYLEIGNRGAIEKRSYPEGHYSLLCCAANRTAQRMSIRVTFRLYASRFGYCAPCI